MQPKLSILIPTHDRSDVLAQTLESLRAVRVPAGADVELVVVANACTDRTEAVVAEAAPSMPLPTRCVAEPTVGLNAARNRCVREAAGGILAMLDDDVWVEPGWLEGLLHVYETRPAQLVGGKVTLWWQAVQRPQWMSDPVEELLTRKDHGGEVKELSAGHDAVGANFSFRREVYDALGGFTAGLDRTGKSLLAAGEYDFISRALGNGFRLFYAPGAAVRHWVAPHRVGDAYLGGVAYGTGMSQVFMKPRFGPAEVARQLAGRSWLIARYGLPEAWAKLRGDRREMMRNRVFRKIGTGGLAGTVKRLAGRSPVVRPGGV